MSFFLSLSSFFFREIANIYRRILDNVIQAEEKHKPYKDLTVPWDRDLILLHKRYHLVSFVTLTLNRVNVNI